MNIASLRRRTAPVFAVVAPLLMLTATGTIQPASAAPQVHTTTHKPNFVQRHPTLTGIGAGVAAHHALKVSARRKKAAHRKLNFAERHPTLTGIGAAVGTHHIIKRTTH